MLKILPPNFFQIGVFTPVFCIFAWKISDISDIFQPFFDRWKFRAGSLPLLHHDANGVEYF